MSKATQTQKVLEYIKTNGSIDPWRAMNDLRIMRLGARIFDLKADGIPIITEIKTNTTANGEHTKWAEYRLEENAP